LISNFQNANSNSSKNFERSQIQNLVSIQLYFEVRTILIEDNRCQFEATVFNILKQFIR